MTKKEWVDENGNLRQLLTSSFAFPHRRLRLAFLLASLLRHRLTQLLGISPLRLLFVLASLLRLRQLA
jgi:hypothetical protein